MEQKGAAKNDQSAAGNDAPKGDSKAQGSPQHRPDAAAQAKPGGTADPQQPAAAQTPMRATPTRMRARSGQDGPAPSRWRGNQAASAKQPPAAAHNAEAKPASKPDNPGGTDNGPKAADKSSARPALAIGAGGRNQTR